MNKTDIEIWYRIYLPTGGDTDVRFRPLDYNSYDAWVDDFQEKIDSLGFVDYDIVSYDYIGREDAWQINRDESVWDKWDALFDVSKDYGVKPEVIVKAADEMGYSDDYEEFMENAYAGQADSMLDFAYQFIDDVYGNDLPKELADRYFDYDKFGYALDVNGDLWSLLMDDWEDRYDTEAEAQAVYDDFMRKSHQEIGEWYIYDMVGDLESALGDKVSDYFDYKSFARDLSYDYTEVDGYFFRSY